MKDSYIILLKKLDDFIKRYYRFKILKGIFLFFTVAFLIIVFESIIEFYNYTSINFRTVIFYSSILLFFSIAVYYIIIPSLALLKIGKRIDEKEAANIISNHFDLVDDNLLNTIELGKNINLSNTKSDLLLASIEQRTKLLNPIPFKFAISFSSIKNSLIYFSLSGLIIFSILSFAPAIFNEGTFRIIKYDKYFEPEAPFSFIINTENFKVKKGDDFLVNISIVGEYIPDEVYISIGGNMFLMEKVLNKKNSFNFIVKNLNNSISIFFVADSYKSKKINISVLAAPVLKDFSISIIPPKYTGINKSILKNSGDLYLPYGSEVEWNFNVNFVDSVLLFFDKDSVSCKSNINLFNFSKRILNSGNYSIVLKNKNFVIDNNINYTINIIPDIFPEIGFNLVEDSLTIGLFYYMINVKDDYGFTKLNLNYRIISNDNMVSKFQSENIDINKSTNNQDIMFSFNFNSLKKNSESVSIEYYFEIFDNDYISGFKSAKTNFIVYRTLSLKDKKHKIEKYEKQTQKSIDDSKKIIDDIKKEIGEFKRKELNNELTEWEKKNFLKSISKKQQKLNENLDKLKNENKKKSDLNNQLYNENKNILEKQKEIQKILDELMDDELKALLDEIEKLKSEFNDKEFEKLKDQLDLSYKELDENLDKSLELLKRFQVEEKVENLVEDIKRVSDRQEKISEKDYKRSDREQQQIEQNSINEQFKELEKEFNKTLEKNSELKRPYKMDEFKKEFEDIKEEQNEISKKISDKSSKKVNEDRKKSSKSMKELAKKMEKMIDKMSSESLDMNMQDLRQIIDNLSSFSFLQEDLYLQLSQTYSNDPMFLEIITKQNKLYSDFGLIKDSINSLATRVPQMNKLLNDELYNLNFSLDKSINELEQRHRRSGIRLQRNVINSTNKLALYLDELNDQLQNQQSQSGGEKGKSKKKKPSMQNLKQQQESLKKQLEQLLKDLKKNGGKKSGTGLNKGVVKSLAEQEKLNKMLNDLQNSEGISPETSKKLKEIKRLSDENVKDLIDMNISQELIKRNETIKSRLLEAEKSEREREKEKIRESIEGENIIREFPAEIEEFLKNKNTHRETLNKNNLILNHFYQKLNDDYNQKIN